jgi:tetratricopeptide (TPR) repeat protein
MRRRLLAAVTGFVVAFGLAGSAAGETSPELNRDKVRTLIEITTMLLTRGNTKDAQVTIKQTREILENLLVANPDSIALQLDLGAVDIVLGDVLQAQRDFVGALAAYRESLAIANAVEQKDPGANGWRRVLVVGGMKIGDVLVAQHDLAGALAAYRDIIAILTALMLQDPNNTEAQRNLAVSYARAGLIASQLNDFAAARDAFEQAKEIALQVKEVPPTGANASPDLAWLDAQLEEIRRKIVGAGRGSRARPGTNGLHENP